MVLSFLVLTASTATRWLRTYKLKSRGCFGRTNGVATFQTLLLRMKALIIICQARTSAVIFRGRCDSVNKFVSIVARYFYATPDRHCYNINFEHDNDAIWLLVSIIEDAFLWRVTKKSLSNIETTPSRHQCCWNDPDLRNLPLHIWSCKSNRAIQRYICVEGIPHMSLWKTILVLEGAFWLLWPRIKLRNLQFNPLHQPFHNNNISRWICRLRELSPADDLCQAIDSREERKTGGRWLRLLFILLALSNLSGLWRTRM